MTFAQFAHALEQLEGTSSRLEITAQLAALFRQFAAAEIKVGCYLLQGQLLPAYHGLEFQIATKTVQKVLARLLPPAATADPAAEVMITSWYQQLGDLGKVAEQVANQRVATQPLNEALSLTAVYDQLLQIARDTGVQSQQRKQEKAISLLAQLDPVSAKFVVRILLGRLRLGFSDMTMIDALSWAMTGDKSEREQLESAYQRRADIGQLASEYLAVSDTAARQQLLREHYSLELGVPVVPALCQRLNTTAEVIAKMGAVLAEPKYDGLRLQLHYGRGQRPDHPPAVLRSFTRNLEESSEMFPELRQAVASLACQSCILDGEVIGYDPGSGQLIPFQQTIQRKRKHGVAAKAAEIPIRYYVFDLLYLNGENLINLPLQQRKAMLAPLFADDQILVHAPAAQTSDPQQLRRFHEEALAEGLEGVVMKQLTSVYQSGRKGWSWVKMKEAEGQTGKLTDTVDVVVLGYYFGRGKRAEFGIGAFLVGVIDEASQRVLTLAKIGTGLSEAALVEVKQRCDQLVVATPPASYVVDKALAPDRWCAPQLVVEVAADELTTSPIHTAGKAMRFPRFVRFRDDKTWQQATTLAELRTIEIAK